MKKIKFLISLFVSLSAIGTLGSYSTAVVNAENTNYTLTFDGMRGTNDNIDTLGVWAGNQNGTCNSHFDDPTASNNHCGAFIQDGDAQFKAYAWANSSGTAFTTPGNYGVYFRYKTSSDDPVSSLSFEWVGDWQIKQTITDFTTQWQECYFVMSLTAESLGNGTCLFDLGSKGTAYVDDFDCVLIDRTVTAGQAIGELPTIPEKVGYTSSWQIDGEDITASTTYNYEENKIARICYTPIPKYTLTFEGMRGTGDNLDSKGVWGANANGTCTNQHSDSTASSGVCTEMIQTGTDQYKVFAWANVACVPFTTPGTYGVYFKYKTSSDDPLASLKFEWCGDWQIKQTITDFTTEWQECYFTMNLSSPFGDGTCLFDLGSKGTVYIDDFTCVLIDRTVTAGEAIGELPNVPDKEGYDGSWQIDGNDITASTIYSYGENKTAVINYVRVYKLIFAGTGDAVTTNMFAAVSGWWSDSGGNNGHTADGTYSTVDFAKAGGGINFTGEVYNYQNVLKDHNYCITFDYYSDNNVSFSVSHHGVSLISNLSATNKWQTCGIAYKCLENLEILKFFNTSNSGVVTFTNLIISEIGESRELKNGDTIGTLPEVPLKTGYKGYWQIDGNDITENTIYSYNDDKVAVARYASIHTLSFQGMRGTGDNFDIGDGAWNYNELGQCDPKYTDSTASDGRCLKMKHTSSFGKQYMVSAWANAAATSFDTPGQYAVCFKYKGDKTDYAGILRFIWSNEIKLTIDEAQTEEWEEYYFVMNLTSDKLGDGTCVFSLDGGTGYIDDFTCVLIDKTVTSGEAIGELPTIPEKVGYTSSWQIDGENITSSTIYSYNINKTATMCYTPLPTYTLTFNGMRGTGDNIDSAGVWPGNDKGTCTNQHSDPTASLGKCGEFIQNGDDTFKATAWANSAATAFTTPGNYGVYFRYKTSSEDPISSLSFEWVGDWQIKQTITNFTTEWQECYFIMTLTAETLGDGTCLFDLGSKGTVYIDDFTCVLIDRTITSGDAIGDLPTIPSKMGEIGSWQIDGNDITASTTYDYGENKIANINYEIITSLVLEGFESTVKYHETFDTTNIVLKANNKIVTPDEYNYEIDSTVLGVQEITAMYNGVSTNENVKVTNNGATPGASSSWTGEDQATSWANFLIDETRKEGGACRLSDRTERVNALKEIWPTFKEEYNWMINDSKDAFFTSSSYKITEARDHYLYIISQYEKDGLEDFVRNSTDNVLQKLNKANSSVWSESVFENNAILTIVVASITLITFTGGGAIYIRKRKSKAK